MVMLGMGQVSRKFLDIDDDWILIKSNIARSVEINLLLFADMLRHVVDY